MFLYYKYWLPWTTNATLPASVFTVLCNVKEGVNIYASRCTCWKLWYIKPLWEALILYRHPSLQKREKEWAVNLLYLWFVLFLIHKRILNRCRIWSTYLHKFTRLTLDLEVYLFPIHFPAGLTRALTVWICLHTLRTPCCMRNFSSLWRRRAPLVWSERFIGSRNRLFSKQYCALTFSERILKILLFYN